MVKHILKVDVSDGARDFESSALEPGVPLLDRNNANDNALRKSLGRLAAQPHRKTVQEEGRQQEIIEFYVCDDQGGRLHDVECEPVTDSDLRKSNSLKQDMEKLKKRLEAVEPVQLRNVLKSQLDALEQQGPAHRECHFFRYREGKTWQLVWCWGFQRKDPEPAHPRICTNSDCVALYVRRSQGSRNCPVCEGKTTAAPVVAEKKSKAGLLVALALLLLLLAGGGVYLMKDKIWPPEPVPGPIVVPDTTPTTTDFVVVPETWEGPAGATIAFAVKRRTLKGEEVVSEEDLSPGAIVVVEHPKVVQFEDGSLNALARSAGQTVIHFYLGNEQATATLTVMPPVNPAKIVLEPATFKLGVGTTKQLQLFGEYPDGKRVDLSKSAQWVAPEGSSLFSHEGWVEGLAEGTGEIRAKYRASAGEPFLEAVAAVEVEDIPYKSLKLALERETVAPGDAVVAIVTLVTESGEEHPATKSSMLKLVVDTLEVADFNEDGMLVALKPGQAKLTVTWKDFEETADFEVQSSDSSTPFDVKPKELALIVGEVTDLAVKAPADALVEMASSDSKIVEIVDGRLVGRAAGSAVVTVSHEAEQQEVQIEVTEADIQSIAIVPESVSLQLNDSAAIRVVATTKDGHEADLAGDVLAIEQLPTASFVDFDPATLTLTGLVPTEGSPQTIALRLEDQKVSAEIEVVAAPAAISLTPTGEVDLPVGQILQLQAIARFAGSRESELSPENVEWVLNPTELSGLEFDPGTGVVLATEAGVGPLTIQASYQGSKSEAVSVKTVAREPLKLALQASPDVIHVGTNGQLGLLIDDPESDAQISMDQTVFESSDEKILAVDPDTGEFLGIAAGEVTVTATHPASETPATLAVTVDNESAEAKPQSLHITSDQGNSVLIPVGAKFGAYRVVAQYESGDTRDVTDSARLVDESMDAENPPISISDRQITGIRPGESKVQAEFEGVRTSDGLTIKVDADVKIVAVQIQPAEFELTVEESATLKAIGLTEIDGKQVPVGDITSSPKLKWESQDGQVLSVVGPAVQGLQVGETTVIASIDAARGTAKASVSEGSPGTDLDVYPDVLQLQVGESKALGSDITVQRGGTDFTAQSNVSSSNSEVVGVDLERGIVTGVSSGRAELLITYGDQSARIPVEVVPPSPGSSGPGTVVIEPATGTLAVGQAQPVRVYFVSESGRRIDRTGSAVIISSDNSVIAVDGNRIIGQAAGNAQIAAQLPESEGWTKASFTVVNETYTRLVISPASIAMSVGDEVGFRVFADGPAGRRELSDHPALKVIAGGNSPSSIEVIGTSRVRGVSPGDASLNVTWNDSLAAQAPVRVTDDVWTNLRIAPTDRTVGLGGRTSFAVFARRGGRERALTEYDGVDLTVADSAVAQSEGGFTVAGVGLGATSVSARLGDMRAAARLTVVTPSSLPHAQRPSRLSPQRLRTGLRFVPDVVALPLGSTGTVVQLKHVMADGRQEDVDHAATFSVDHPNVVEVGATGAGVPLIPRAVGQTRVHAEYEGMSASLFVQVLGDVSRARMIVRPDPLRLRVGQSAEFGQVLLSPGRGTTPFEVGYQVVASSGGIVDVVNNRVVRGLAPGTTHVTVAPVGAGEAFETLSSTVTVVVSPAGVIPTATVRGAHLVLRGPSATTVGADAAYSVQLVTPSGIVDVTNDATTLVLDRTQTDKANTLAGCVLRALQPGVVHVRAQHGGLISNSIRLHINALATGFRRLELDVARAAMAVNEARPYRVWAYPANGQPRQDVTNSSTLNLSQASDVATHSATQVIANAPGECTIQAELGGMQSNAVTLVIGGVPLTRYTLVANPPVITIRVGELTPALQIFARRPGVRDTPVNATLEATSNILAPSTDQPGRFVGKSRGDTSIRASTADAETVIRVTVVGSPFAEVKVVGAKRVGDNQFVANINVRGDRTQGTRQYRVVSDGSGEASVWVTASTEGDQVKASLESPRIREEAEGETYRLVVESRDGESGVLDRYPCGFTVELTIKTN